MVIWGRVHARLSIMKVTNGKKQLNLLNFVLNCDIVITVKIDYGQIVMIQSKLELLTFISLPNC